MSKPASTAKLAALHAMFAEYLTGILQQAQEGGEEALPLDAATMGVIKAFLKDNSITADPADDEALKKLRENFSRAAQGVVGKAVSAARDDADKPYLQ